MDIVTNMFRQGREAEVVQIKKEEIELSLFTDGMVLYVTVLWNLQKR